MSEWSDQAAATLYFFTDTMSWLDVVEIRLTPLDGSTLITLRSCSSGLLPVSFPGAPFLNAVSGGALHQPKHGSATRRQGATERSFGLSKPLTIHINVVSLTQGLRRSCFSCTADIKLKSLSDLVGSTRYHFISCPFKLQRTPNTPI